MVLIALVRLGCRSGGSIVIDEGGGASPHLHFSKNYTEKINAGSEKRKIDGIGSPSPSKTCLSKNDGNFGMSLGCSWSGQEGIEWAGRIKS